MPDFEIHANTAQQMLQTANNFGFVNTSVDTGTPGTIKADGYTKDEGVRYSINYYGTKFVPSGAFTTNAHGIQVPVYTALAGVYAILRWSSDTVPFPPPGKSFPNGVSAVSPIPDDSPVVFAALAMTRG